MKLFGFVISKAPAEPKPAAPPSNRKVDLTSVALAVAGGLVQLPSPDVLTAHGVAPYLAHALGYLALAAGVVLRIVSNPTAPKGEVSVTAPPFAAANIRNKAEQAPPPPVEDIQAGPGTTEAAAPWYGK